MNLVEIIFNTDFYESCNFITSNKKKINLPHQQSAHPPLNNPHHHDYNFFLKPQK